MRRLLSLLLVAATALPAEAQIMRAIQKKAADAVAKKAEAKLDEKIEAMADKMVNNTFDAVFGGFEGADGSKTPPIKLPGDAKTADRYAFSLVLDMDMVVTDRDGKREPPVTMRMHFAKDRPYTATQVSSAETRRQGGDVVVIFDAEHEAMVMLMASEGKQFSMAYGWREAAAAAQRAAAQTAAQETAPPADAEQWKQWTRIGTRRIAGYETTGYRATEEGQTVEVWVSRDPALVGAGWFGAHGGTKALQGRLPSEVPVGMLLALTSSKADSKEAMTMTATKVDPKADVTFVMADWPRVGAAGK